MLILEQRQQFKFKENHGTGMKKLYHLQSIKNYRKIIGIIQVLRITI